MNRLLNIVVLLRRQLWIVPLLFSIAGIGLALLIGNISLRLSPILEPWSAWLYGGDLRAARDLLATFLSGLMTMTSLIVSVTFVILSLAANQLGPRLIGIYMSDRQIQAALGLFFGTILYVIVTARSMDTQVGDEGALQLAVSVASLLTIICLFALLFYVHKIARLIISDTVVERVAEELRAEIATLPAKKTDAPERDTSRIEKPANGAISIGESGYVQTIDYYGLVQTAKRHDAVLEVDIRAGHFILPSGDHIRVFSARERDEELNRQVRDAVTVGRERSPAQDIEYAIRQLVEIALRALSPGINDVFTGIAVVDRLAAGLEDIFTRSLPPSVFRDDVGRVRVIANQSDIRGLVGASFDAIRQAGKGHPAILIRCADVFGQLANVLTHADERNVVLEHLHKLGETADAGDLTPCDRAAVFARIEQARTAIRAVPRRGAGKEQEPCEEKSNVS